MEYRTLGRTGLRVSLCGMGGGGTSRLGLSSGSTPEQAIDIVRRGFELGINYFDSSQSYATEEIFGRALEGHRDEVILASKVRPFHRDGSYFSGSEVRETVENALENFRTDFIDVYHMHHLTVENFDFSMGTVVPELIALRDEGKIRFIAASEHTETDAEHEALRRAVEDDYWDVFMVAYNLFNQSARPLLFPQTIDKEVGIEIMIAARNHFSKADRLSNEILRLADEGLIDGTKIDRENPLGFILDDHEVGSVAEASYRMVAEEPGVHVVLVGTGNVEHLEENIRSLNAGPLPPELREQFVSLFGDLAVAVERIA